MIFLHVKSTTPTYESSITIKMSVFSEFKFVDPTPSKNDAFRLRRTTRAVVVISTGPILLIEDRHGPSSSTVQNNLK